MQCLTNLEELPVLHECDTLVIGGTLAGIALAIKLVEAGKEVVVIEPRTYLGAELTATLRPWIDVTSEAELPTLIKQCLLRDEKSVGDTSAIDHVRFAQHPGYTALHPDKLKCGLEELLMNREIPFVYATLPTEILLDDGEVSGVIVANKSGRQIIRVRNIVDTTETAISASLLGCPLQKHRRATLARYDRSLEFFSANGEFEDGETEVPHELNLFSNRVNVRYGYRGRNHVYVQYGMELDYDNSIEMSHRREERARMAGMELAAYLTEHVSSFKKSVLSAASYELSGPFSLVTERNHLNQRSDFERLAVGHPSVICLYKDLYHDGNEEVLHPVHALRLGEQVAKWMIQHPLKASANGWISNSNSVHSVITENDLEISAASAFQDMWDKEVEIARSTAIPVGRKAQVLVVGGGTSGACASITAAREGMSTVLLELNPGLGGTGTFGGVDSYWFGRRVGYAARIEQWVKEVQQSIHYKGHKWNIEAKMHALLLEASKAGTDLMFNCITWGAVRKGNQVCGAAVATRWGPQIILADTVIDATGGGDVAAFAGAEYVYGSQKDHTVMWYSLAQYTTPAKLQNNFTSMVNVASILDYTRAIVTGRRRGTDCHDHGIYIATRESRHIVGDVVMQLTDQLLHRRWPDVVNVHFSNHDVKGISGADWVNIGLIPPNLEIEIPYRMLLPKGLEGILVVGKALSATHDALPAIRMQSDLENLGGVAALAAAEAISSGKRPRYIDLGKLQGRLIQEGLISSDSLHRSLEKVEFSDQELECLVDSIETDAPLYEYSNMRMNEVYDRPIPFVEICSLGTKVVPYLEKALLKAEGRKKIVLAQALSMLGSTSGVSVLVEDIMKQLSGNELPVRTSDIMYVQLPPDHGAMPDVTYEIYSLAAARDERSIEVWERVAELLQPTEADFKDTWKGIYYYIDAVCQGAERLGSRQAIPLLLKLHQVPFLNGQECKEGIQPDYFLERRSMLELAIGRALARSGSPEGYEILIRYISDVRSLLSLQALGELRRLTNEDYGPDSHNWQAWLAQHKHAIQPLPLSLTLDIERNSERIER